MGYEGWWGTLRLKAGAKGELAKASSAGWNLSRVVNEPGGVAGQGGEAGVQVDEAALAFSLVDGQEGLSRRVLMGPLAKVSS